MAIINYEPLGASDVTTTKTLLHESIPMTGSIMTGTYQEGSTETNIKNYTHGMFQSVYDYPFLSSSANHIMDLTIGYNKSSALSGSPGGTSTMETKKFNLYNQFSQVLLGYTGSDNVTRDFELDLTLDQTGSMQEAFFVNLSRLLCKDEIKPGSVSITVGTGAYATPFDSPATSTSGSVIVLADPSASVNAGTLNTLGGNYGLLYTRYGPAGSYVYHTPVRGVVFYQAGIVVLATGSFDGIVFNSGSILSGSGPSPLTIPQSFVSASISGNCNALRRRMQNISFNNTTEINSTIYFCRVPHNKYNYSTNPTYVSASQVRVKNIATDPPVSYITTIGLYSSNNELLALAKVSEPLKKNPNNDITLRVRLDY